MSVGSPRSWITLLGLVLLCLAVGGIGSLWTMQAIPEWYAGLRKPSWTPPAGVFGPVWTLLYITMGIAAWLVWRKEGWAGAVVPLALFAVQLALNLAWSGIFFGLRQPGWAFLEIVLLWGAIVATMVAFFRVVPAAGWLLAPYLLWVTFAAALNFAVWSLNT